MKTKLVIEETKIVKTTIELTHEQEILIENVMFGFGLDLYGAYKYLEKVGLLDDANECTLEATKRKKISMFKENKKILDDCLM